MTTDNKINLSRYLDPRLISMELQTNSKMEAVDFLAGLFKAKYPDKNIEEITNSARERESLGPTSMGRGFAFPHARTNIVKELHLVIGVNKTGMSEVGPDGLPLKAIFLLITPQNATGFYLQILSCLAKFARRPGILDEIVKLNSPEGLIELIEKYTA